MNLREIREQFVKKSGRYDLVTEDWEDDGADFFIQAGVGFLDRRANFEYHSLGHHLVGVNAGEQTVLVPQCWLISQVSRMTAGEVWQPLSRIAAEGVIAGRFNRMQGTPIFYSFATIQHQLTLQGLATHKIDLPADLFNVGDFGVHVFVLTLSPTPAVDLILRIDGRFYSAPMERDDDQNYWSLGHPEVLIKAAMYQLETFYRNREGAADWLETIQLDLRDIEILQIEQHILGRNQMEG